jgi:hypothetical protein
MGYGYYTIHHYGQDRPAGHMVLATCDRRGCDVEIDRGLGYICGQSPHDRFDAAPGCGRYYCGSHEGWIGPRGGCSHRGDKAWGTTLSCMEPNSERSVVCLYRSGHRGPHAWADGSQDG